MLIEIWAKYAFSSLSHHFLSTVFRTNSNCPAARFFCTACGVKSCPFIARYTPCGRCWAAATGIANIEDGIGIAKTCRLHGARQHDGFIRDFLQTPCGIHHGIGTVGNQNMCTGLSFDMIDDMPAVFCTDFPGCPFLRMDSTSNGNPARASLRISFTTGPPIRYSLRASKYTLSRVPPVQNIFS